MEETKKIKFLCSFGGKILEDPRDGNLVYVGGTTKVIGISSATSWQQLKQKSMSIYNQPHAIKYELPGLDLDVLVSVHSDQNLQHMIQFCGGGGKLPRMFLFDVNSSSVGPSVVSASGSSNYEASATDVASSGPPSWSTTSGRSESSQTALSSGASNISERNEDPLEGYPQRPPPGNSQGVVLYTSTLGGVRKTLEKCEIAPRAVEGTAAEAGVEVDERDVWLHKEFLAELRELVGMGAVVPRLFIRGRYIGGVEEVEELADAGRLREMMRCVKGGKAARRGCERCSGARFVTCFGCDGSGKVVVKDNAVRCGVCDNYGLVLCPLCHH